MMPVGSKKKKSYKIEREASAISRRGMIALKEWCWNSASCGVLSDITAGAMR